MELLWIICYNLWNKKERKNIFACVHMKLLWKDKKQVTSCPRGREFRGQGEEISRLLPTFLYWLHFFWLKYCFHSKKQNKTGVGNWKTKLVDSCYKSAVKTCIRLSQGKGKQCNPDTVEVFPVPHPQYHSPLLGKYSTGYKRTVLSL